MTPISLIWTRAFPRGKNSDETFIVESPEAKRHILERENVKNYTGEESGRT